METSLPCHCDGRSSAHGACTARRPSSDRSHGWSGMRSRAKPATRSVQQWFVTVRLACRDGTGRGRTGAACTPALMAT